MLIRPVHPDDFSSIAALTNRYITTTAIHFAHHPVLAEDLRASWLKTIDIYPFLIVEAPPAPGVSPVFAGFAKAYRWREREAYQRTAETGIYIEPAFHGKGLGRALYAALIDACRAAGLHTLIAGIALPNDPSIRLHEALGFTHVGVTREVGWKFDRWHDVAFMQLMLPPPGPGASARA